MHDRKKEKKRERNGNSAAKEMLQNALSANSGGWK